MLFLNVEATIFIKVVHLTFFTNYHKDIKVFIKFSSKFVQVR